MAWLPSVPREDLRAVYVGHIVSPTSFYVSEPRAVWASEAVLATIDLEDDLNANAKNLQPLSRDLVRGDLCCIKTRDHCFWRRGRVLDVLDGGRKADILMMDYGDICKAVELWAFVRELPQTYWAHEQLAFELRIPGNSLFNSMA